MIASTGGGIDLARLLLDLLIVIGAAKLLAEVAERLRVPAVLGEILAGVLVGPSALGLVELHAERGVSISLLAELGVLLLLLQVGMEMDLAELGKVGTASLLVAVIGVAVPFAGGAAVGFAFGQSTNTAIFIGAALTATSVGITARVFGDLRALATTEARVVLGAAVADDVLGLVILTVVVKIVTGGSVGVGTVAGTLGLAIAFLVGTGIVGLLAVPRLLEAVHRRASSPATVTVVALALTLGFAELADLAKLAFIIGAFMAGLSIGRSHQHERVARDLGAVGNVLIPVFFAQIGINADLAAMVKPSVLGIAAVLTVVAVVGKLASALGARGTRADRLLIGLGMIPRGEVGLIFASIGLTNGVLNADEYGALLIVVLLTTVLTPPLLRWRLGRAASVPVAELEVTPEPEQGWLTVAQGEVVLHGTPPVALTVPMALRTALLAKNARPSSGLLDWFAANRGAPLAWSRDDTALLVRVLRDDNARAWRFLDVSGVLERALPEVAEVMARRRADIGDLDPLGALRFPIVERLDDLAAERGLPSDDLLLAALVADVCADRDERSCGAQLAGRLASESEAERIVSLVEDAALLRAGLHATDAFDEHELLQLATHLASPAHARDSHELALAMGPLHRWQREALDERVRLVVEALEHPELTGSEANNLAAARRLAAEHLLEETEPIERLRHASNAYLLAHDAEELARQVRLLEPLPRRGVVRVAVSPEPEPDHWKIDVACRDLSGLLARLAEVLSDQGLDVASAAIATWPDGAVLDSFVVISRDRPSARELAGAFEARLRGAPTRLAMPELEVSFDNEALPWHTSVTVSGTDRPGVLLAVSAAFAAADVVVHTARIATAADTVSDRFAVTDRLGHKLDASAMARVRAALAGEKPRRPRALSLSSR